MFHSLATPMAAARESKSADRWVSTTLYGCPRLNSDQPSRPDMACWQRICKKVVKPQVATTTARMNRAWWHLGGCGNMDKRGSSGREGHTKGTTTKCVPTRGKRWPTRQTKNIKYIHLGGGVDIYVGTCKMGEVFCPLLHDTLRVYVPYPLSFIFETGSRT